MRLKGTSAYSAIKLAEGQQVPREVQVLRVGKFNHPKYGSFEITPLTLQEMKSNFDAEIRGIDMSFDYYHDSDKDASAWVYGLELREGGTELWATEVEWTPKAEKKLADKELRYFSPDFAFKWEDPEHGTEHKNVLFGGGLTNRPFVKEMKAIVADETQGENMTDLEKANAKVADYEKKNLKLSEEKAAAEKELADLTPKANRVSELEAQIAKLQAELDAEKKKSEIALADKAKADEAKVLAEKTSSFNVLLSEGKACAAQKDAFLKGDMAEFVKLAQPVNLKGSGSSQGGNDAAATSAEDAQKVIKLAEEKKKANPALSHGDAISAAKRELKL